jgi:hypothetical protein
VCVVLWPLATVRVLGIAGLVLVVDDLVQHVVRAWYKAAWRSPVNRLWGLVLRLFK